MNDQKAIRSIQALRGIAATMVVIYHAVNRLQENSLIPDVPRFIETGRAGVDIFFVISGFIMVWISGDRFGTPGAARDFLIRRLIRVAPTYWFYTLLMAALMAAFPHMVSQGKTVDMQHLMASLAFIPWQNSIGETKPILGVGWTLNYEMYFYAVFSSLLFFSRAFFLPLLTTILLSGIVAGLMMDHHPVILDVITSPLLVEFLMGCAIGVCYRRCTSSPASSVLVSMLIAGVAALIVGGMVPIPGLPREIKLGVPAALIVGSAVFLERARTMKIGVLLTTLGDSSYSLYLSHIFTVAVIGKAWVTLIGSHPAGLASILSFVIIATAGAIVTAHIAYLLFEKPITSHLNGMYRNAVRGTPGRKQYVST